MDCSSCVTLVPIAAAALFANFFSFAGQPEKLEDDEVLRRPGPVAAIL
jgi:hypothetical protein